MICSDLHSALASLLARYEKDQIAFVYDSRLSDAVHSLTAQWPDCSLPLNISENDKSLQTVSQIWDHLLAHHMTRRGILVCIGGGTLTDIGGFAAATYKRGMDYSNIPTTLLAMVDASSGGKTGVNYNGLKNTIGCFASPVQTLVWPGWLKTLPPHEFLSGFGEMLKTGLIANDESTNADSLWNRLLRYDLDTMDVEKLTPLIEECIRIKEQIVSADPRETGLRKVLNFGHTFGHALEEISLTGAAGLLHGYAVVYGLIAELYLSVINMGCPKEPLQQLTQLMLHYYGRPQCKCSDREALIRLMQQDKKNERTAEINCTLIRQIGVPVINQVITPEQADEALEYLFAL
jgi:3-dehydroquinate synthase